MSSFTATASVRRRLGVALAVLGLLGALFAARQQHLENEDRIGAQVGQALEHIKEQLDERIRVYEYGLQGARGALMVAGGESVTRRQFQTYARSRDLAQEFPGALGIGFVRRVPRDHESEFLEAARADDWPTFALRELAPHSGERMVVQYIEPVATNLSALGLDIASEESRRSAAQLAARSGRATLTAPVELSQLQQGLRIGQLMFLPVYRDGPMPATEAEREAQVFGWVYNPLALGRLLDAIHFLSTDVTLEISDTTSASHAPIVMYSSRPRSGDEPRADSIELQLYGRRWRVECAATPALVQRLKLTSPWTSFALTLFAALLAALAVQLYSSFADRRAAFAARRQTDALIMEGSDDAMISTNLTGEVIGWNAGATRMLGYTAHERIGRQLVELYVEPEDAVLHVAGALDKVQHFDALWRTREGRELVVSLTRSPVRDAVGRLTALLVTARDVTKLQAAMELLRASERRFRVLAESLPQMVWTCRSDGMCDYLGPQWVEYTGIAEAEQLGSGWLDRLHPDDREPTKLSWARATTDGALLDIEFRIQRHDGVYRWFKTRAVPLRDSAGQITKWLGTNTDIQDIKDVELANQRLMHELESHVDERTVELRKAYERLSTLTIQLQNALTVANVGSWELHIATGRVVWSSELFRIFAMDPAQEAPNYERQQSLFEPESWARLTRVVDESIRTGVGYNLVLTAIRSDGVKFSAFARAQIQRGPSGQVERLVGIFQDVSEQERAAEAVKSLSERLQLATSAARIGVWELNVATNSLEWDHTMRELYGVENADAMDLHAAWRNALHPDDRDAAQTLLRAAIAGEAQFRTLVRLQRANGEIRHIRSEAALFTDAAGRPARVIGVDWDVTEQRVAELALRRADALQRAVVTSAGSAIIATDPEGVITLFNRAAEELLGYTAQEVIGKHTPGIWHDSNELEARRALVEAELGAPVPTPFDVFVMKSRIRRKPDTNEWTYIRSDGSRVAVQLTISTLFDEESKVTGYLGVAFDLTQRKRHEAELVELNRLLEERSQQAESASHAKGMFLANMSHEIRTPIGAIRSTTYLLSRTTLSNEQTSLVDTIGRSAKVLLGMVNDVLDLSKIEAQQLTLDEAPFALHDVIDDLASLMNAFAAGKPLELILDARAKVTQMLWGDRVRLMQVLTNLVGNAIKFTDSGSVRVVVSAVEENAEQLRLHFEVHDTGPGMNAALLEKLFRPFTQAEEAGTRRYGGTGLGLAIVKQLVELMGGRVSVRSQVGVGSEFQCEIPLKKVARSQHRMPALAVRRVLVVDDHDLQRAALESCARQLGWRVEAVASGEEALTRVVQAGTEDPFDVVLMDWKMPGMDGLRTIEAIRRSQRDPEQLIFVMTTAHDLAEVRAHPLSHLTDAALSKPVSTSTLLDAVTRITAERSDKHGDNPIPSKAESGQHRLAGLRVLVADDNEINRTITRRLLELEGADVSLAVDGQDAAKQVRGSAAPFSVVLMDVQMPVIDGIDATRDLRTDPRFAALPILALTAGALASERERALAAGMNDFVTKPFEPEVLIETLRRYVPRRASRSQPSAPQPSAAITHSIERDGWPTADGFDVSKARQNLAGDHELFCSLTLKLEELLGHFPPEHEPVDVVAFAAWAHKLCGAAGSLGADGLAATAHTLSLALAAQDSTAAAASKAQLLEEMARARRGIAQVQASSLRQRQSHGS